MALRRHRQRHTNQRSKCIAKHSLIMSSKKRESLTAAQHLAKYGADMAFYVNTEEGANIICKPLPYSRLRGDTRQKVL